MRNEHFLHALIRGGKFWPQNSWKYDRRPISSASQRAFLKRYDRILRREWTASSRRKIRSHFFPSTNQKPSSWSFAFSLKENININICSTELKWDGKKLNYDDNEMRWIRIYGVKWRRFIVSKKLNKLMTMHLFIDIYKSNNIKIGVNDMTMNDSEMCVRWKRQALSIPEISVLR